MQSGRRHQCIIYSGDPSLKLQELAATMQQMMMAGYRCLYINSTSMVEDMKSSLAALGIDVILEISNNSLVFSSDQPSETDDFNIDQMLNVLECAIDQALEDGFKGLWASGDMSWELGPEKNFEKLLEYEWKLEQLFQKRKEFHGLCQYHCDTLPQEVIRKGVLMHHSLFVNETLSRINPLYNSGLPSANKASNPMLDKFITELCQVNIEVSRRPIK